jgi:hypothetical protein
MLRPIFVAIACLAFNLLFQAYPNQAIAQSSSPNQGPTLAEALAQAQPPERGTTVFTVAADNVPFPETASPLGQAPNISTIAADYDRLTPDFGSIIVLAPPTMVVINTAPSAPDPYAGIGRAGALTLLVASLTDSQWAELISATGLPISELTQPIQQELVTRLLPSSGKLIARPEDEFGVDYRPANYSLGQPVDITGDVQQSALRVGRGVEFTAPTDATEFYPAILYGTRLAPGPHYELDGQESNKPHPQASVFGVPVRAVVTNILKQSQLDYSERALQRTVSLAGAKTVGDLIARIGAVTGVEMYADARLEGLDVTTMGETTARASDVLQAIAYCVTGTYRQVGPAFVLTDEITGIGTRMQLWRDYEQEAASMAAKPIDAAVDKIDARRTPADLPWFESPGDYNSAQKLATAQQLKVPPSATAAYMPYAFSTFAQLTPGQQEMMSRAISDWNSQISGTPIWPGSTDKYPSLTKTGSFMLESGFSVELLDPSLDGPVDLTDDNAGESPFETIMFGDQWKKLTANVPEDVKPKPTTPSPVPDVVAVLKQAGHRAAYVGPRTAAGIRAEIASMKTLGLNELWLDVFSNGEAHIPGSPLTALPSLLKSSDSDILTEALRDAPAAGIKVFAVVDLLFWGPDPPSDACDLNILGETSAQAAVISQQQSALLPKGHVLSEYYLPGNIVPDFPGVAVSEASAGVRRDLIALVRKLAATPGIAGIVFRDTDPPGYNIVGNRIDISNLLLGYGPYTRLAFLRAKHADPVDVYPMHFHIGSADTGLPMFQLDGDEGQTLDDEWVQYRRDENISFLTDLYKAATGAAGTAKLTILLKQRGHGEPDIDDDTGVFTFPPGWYGSWDDVKSPPPTLRVAFEENQDTPAGVQASKSEMDQARAQSHTVYAAFTRSRLDADGSDLKALKTEICGPDADGFVLDLSDDPYGDDGKGDDPLAHLAEEASEK